MSYSLTRHTACFYESNVFEGRCAVCCPRECTYLGPEFCMRPQPPPPYPLLVNMLLFRPMPYFLHTISDLAYLPEEAPRLSLSWPAFRSRLVSCLLSPDTFLANSIVNDGVAFLVSPIATICIRVYGTRVTLGIGVVFET